MSQSAPARSARDISYRICIGLVLLIGCAYALSPGDAPFAFDEPLLIGKAMRANSAHTLAASGLHGTKGITYSPLPVWIYQVMLLISHDLRALVAMRAIVCAAAVGMSLLWLAKNLDLPVWFAPVVMFSPSLWFFCRQLWDNTFCIPLSALALATYVQFLKSNSRGALAVCIACLLGSMLIHVMALPMVAPIALHMLIARRAALLRNWLIITIELLVACAIAIQWFRVMFQGQGRDIGAGADGWWFPILGARTISAANLSYIFGEQWDSAGGNVGSIVHAATYISFLAYPLMWLGMGVCAYRVMEVLSRQRQSELRDAVAFLLLGTIVAQTLMDGIGCIYGLPHYYNGTWIAFPMLAWLGIDLLRHARLAMVAIAAQGASLLVLVGFLALTVHRGNGVLNVFYGPSIGVRITVINTLNARGWHGPFAFARPGSDQYVVDPLNSEVPLTPIYTDRPAFLAYPQSMNVIEELTSPGRATSPLGRRLEIRLAHPQARRCELEIVER